MFADGWNGGDFRSIPDDLLADCQDSARMAERVVRDIEPGPDSAHAPADLLDTRPPDALSWAIKAMQGDGPSGRASAGSALVPDSASTQDPASVPDPASAPVPTSPRRP